MSLFKDASGNFKWSIVPAIAGILALIFILFLHQIFFYNFTHDFWSAGIWQIVGPIAGSVIAYLYWKYFSATANDNVFVSIALQFLAVLFFYGGLIAPSTSLFAKRADGIAVNYYYSNGKIINTSDPSKDNYYFSNFKIDSVDSAYIVKYDEEPGFNNTVKNREGVDSSSAPRANENWTRPEPNSALQLKGKY